MEFRTFPERAWLTLTEADLPADSKVLLSNKEIEAKLNQMTDKVLQREFINRRDGFVTVRAYLERGAFEFAQGIADRYQRATGIEAPILPLKASATIGQTTAEPQVDEQWLDGWLDYIGYQRWYPSRVKLEIYEDLEDTGKTWQSLVESLTARGFKSDNLDLIAMMSKAKALGKRSRATDCGFVIPNWWVYGYGPDNGNEGPDFNPRRELPERSRQYDCVAYYDPDYVYL